MKRIIPILFLCLCGCSTTKTITVLDVKTDQPIPNLELSERITRKPDSGDTEVIIENTFITDENGQIVIPRSCRPSPTRDSGYTTWHGEVFKKQADVSTSKVLYVIEEK